MKLLLAALVVPALASIGSAPLGAAPGTGAGLEALEPVPEARFEVMEPAVREQLRKARAELEALQRNQAASEADLVRGFGLLGRLYHAYDLFTPAGACYRNAARLDPRDFRWPYYLGVLHRLDGRDGEALAAFTTASKLRPNHLPIMLHLAGLHLGNGRNQEAARLYEQVLASHPGSAAAHLGLGRISSVSGDHAAAISRFEKALELQPEAGRTHYLLGQEYRRLGDLELASEHLAQIGSVGVGFFEPLLLEVQRLAVGAGAALGRGGDAQMLGLYDIALREYRRAVAEVPANAAARFALGSLLVAVGSLDEAIEHLREAVRLDPDHPQPRFLLGHVLFQQGRFAEAEPELERVLESDPGHREARMSLAALLASTQRFEESISLYRAVVEADPGDHDGRLNLGKALVMMANTEEGLAEFDAVLAEATDHATLALAHYNRAVVEAWQGARESAVSSLDTALELDSELMDARVLVARLLAVLGRLEAAARQYDEILARDPANWSARLAGSGVLAAAGRMAEARARLEEGLAVDPESRPLALTLARMLACGADARVRDGAAALALAEKLFAAERSLENAETLGMALAQAGRFDQAAQLQEELAAESRRRGRAAWAEHLDRNLERYRRGQTCRIDPGPAPAR
ncbi:MAG: tetratricopeptide repeat protein [Acidobacteria bacterium]|nr:tetratricopeptide repeat protein [Acidobacteriota bacterium]